MMNKSCVPSFHRRPFNKFLGRISVKYFILDKNKRMKKHPYDRNIPLETYYLVIDLILNNYFLQILKLSYYPNQCCDEKDLLTLSQYSSVCLWATHGWPIGVPLSRIDWGRENTRSRHLVLWSRNHEYSALTWKDQSYYQSMGSKFRYGLGKVLGTQNYPTCGSASIYCVLCLNPIKGTFNMAYKHTHTHTHTHTYTHIHAHTHIHQHTSKHTTWHFIPSIQRASQICKAHTRSV